MKLLLPTAILALAVAVSAQDACSAEIAAVPTCAISCIDKASTDFGCEVGDYNCLCGFIDDLVGAAGTCVFGACSDPVAVLNAANAACACLAAQPEPETPPTTTPVPETPAPTPSPTAAPLPPGNPAVCDPLTDSIPLCARECLALGADGVGCGQTDYICKCETATRNKITEIAIDCVFEKCAANFDDVLKTIDSTDAICACASENGPDTPVDPSPTTPDDPGPTSVPPPFNGSPIECDPIAAKIPECAKECFNNAAVQAGCGEYDYGCQCKQPTRDALTEIIVPCVAETCIDPANPDDIEEILKLLEVAEEICQCAKDNAPSEPPITTTTTSITSSTSEIPGPTESACSDEIAAVPICAIAPINKGGAGLGCAENDYGCLCANYDALIGAIAGSVLGACGDEATAVLGAASAVCQCIGEDTPLPPPVCEEEISAVPICAIAPINAGGAGLGCAENDYNCLCANYDALLGAIAGSVLEACGEEATAVLGAASAVCECIGEGTDPAPGPGPGPAPERPPANPWPTEPAKCDNLEEKLTECATYCWRQQFQPLGCDPKDYECACKVGDIPLYPVIGFPFLDCIEKYCGIEAAPGAPDQPGGDLVDLITLSNKTGLCACALGLEEEEPPLPVGNPPECDSLVKDIPECAKTCLNTAAEKSGCDQTDYLCKCDPDTKAAISKVATPCVIDACPDINDLFKTIDATDAICRCADEHKPDGGSTSTTTTTSTTTSETSSTTTSETTTSCEIPTPTPVCVEEIAAVPTCALGCINDASTTFGCAEGDYNCLCGFIDDLVEVAGTCVFGACSDPLSVLNAANAACACLAAAPPQTTYSYACPDDSTTTTTTTSDTSSSTTSQTTTTTPTDTSSSTTSITTTSCKIPTPTPVCVEEIAAVPSCAVTCIDNASTSFGCEVGDYNCLCGFIDDLVGAAGTCVFGACSDPIAVLNAANAACTCLADAPPQPTNSYQCPGETTTPPPGGGSGETTKPPPGGTTIITTVIVTDTVTTCPVTTTKCADNTCSIITTHTVSTISLTSTKTITSCDGGCPTKKPNPGHGDGKPGHGEEKPGNENPPTIYTTIITTDVVTDCPITETHVDNGETSYDIRTTQSTVKVTKTSTVTSCEAGCETAAPGHEDEEKPGKGEEEPEKPEHPAPGGKKPTEGEKPAPGGETPEKLEKPAEGEKPAPDGEKPEEEKPEALAPGAEQPEKLDEETPKAPAQPTNPDVPSVPQESEPAKFTGGATSISVSFAAIFMAVVAVL